MPGERRDEDEKNLDETEGKLNRFSESISYPSDGGVTNPFREEEGPLEDGIPPVGESEEPTDQARSCHVRDDWPAPLADDAFHGLAGDFVQMVEPHSEADPAALLVQFLAAVGSLIGRTAHARVEADDHYTNLFVALVGETSKARKGTGLGHVRRALRDVDRGWDRSCIHSGLSSGEGLIWSVRDAIERQEPVRESKKIVSYQRVIVDEGVEDKRALIVEPELASVLSVIGRQGNTLSPVIRNAWDRGDLEGMTKNSPARATAAHISIIGHVTRDELRASLTATETANGFANRFLWICSKRSKFLPDGGSVPETDRRAIADRLRAVVVSAGRTDLMKRDGPASKVWHEVYRDLSEGEPGLFGAVTNRAEAQVLRLSLLYAVLDQARAVGSRHLRAALAVWDYADASARYIFGDKIGDPVADDIDRALRNAGSTGMTRTEISGLFGRNQTRERLEAALDVLKRYRRARFEMAPGPDGGRSAERWFSLLV